MALPSRIGNWQAELDDLLKSSQDNGDLTKFGILQTDADRSRFIFDKKLLGSVTWLKDYFGDLWQVFHRKDAERAARHKQEGNKLFLACQDKLALQAYTRSMQFAGSHKEQDNEGGDDLAVAYGNRSAVLFRLHKYQNCLTDIQRALDAGPANQSRTKLLVRRCLCCAKLGQKNKAVAAQQDVLSLLDGCDSKTARYVEGELRKVKAQIESIPDSGSADAGHVQQTQSLPLPAVSYGTNSVLVQASSAVEMKTSVSQGRFLQATQNIKAGDTLIVERPFATVLLPPHYSTHCLHCFVPLPDHPVGCQRCSNVLYCCEHCRDTAWLRYHHLECCYSPLLHSVGIAHLALRIVLTVGLLGLQDFLDQRKKSGAQLPEAIPGVTQEGRYERNYLSVYDLMTHTQDMATEDLFQYSLTANLLLAILVHAGWFSPPPPQTQEQSSKARSADVMAFLQGDLFLSTQQTSGLEAEQVFMVGGVLLRHMQQLVCNAHAITALQSTQVGQEDLVETQSQVRIATAIYPTASLMNHSCDPTIISSFQKDVLVVKSMKDVVKGEEIFSCYGPHCKRMRRAERQEVLRSQYFFDCQCGPCATDLANRSASEQGIRCAQCGGTIVSEQERSSCPDCGAVVHMASILSELQLADAHFREATSHLEHGDLSKALEKFKACLAVRSTVMSSNNHDLGQVHDAIAQCLARTGRYKEAAHHLAQSVAVTEAVFGADSVETAREWHKMAEVLIHAGRPQEALEMARRALNSASKLYDHTDQWLQELLCLNTALTNIIADGACH